MICLSIHCKATEGFEWTFNINALKLILLRMSQLLGSFRVILPRVLNTVHAYGEPLNCFVLSL